MKTVCAITMPLIMSQQQQQIPNTLLAQAIRKPDNSMHGIFRLFCDFPWWVTFIQKLRVQYLASPSMTRIHLRTTCVYSSSEIGGRPAASARDGLYVTRCRRPGATKSHCSGTEWPLPSPASPRGRRMTAANWTYFASSGRLLWTNNIASTVVCCCAGGPSWQRVKNTSLYVAADAS